MTCPTEFAAIGQHDAVDWEYSSVYQSCADLLKFLRAFYLGPFAF